MKIERLVLSLMVLAVVAIGVLPPAGIEGGRFGTVEGGPHYVIVREVTDEQYTVRGVHFNIFPIGPGIDTDRVLMLVRDLARKGFTNVLFFVSPGAAFSPDFQEVLSVTKALGMRVIIRFNIPFGSDLGSPDLWNNVASEAVFYHREFGVDALQFLNEIDATQDWDWGTVCSRPETWGEIWGLDVGVACTRWDSLGPSVSHFYPIVPIVDLWYWENMYQYVPGYTALGLYAADRVSQFTKHMLDYGIVGARGVPGTRQPDFMVVVPPIVDDTHLEEYYTGFFAYWTSRRSGAWGLPIGGLGMNELPGWASPLVTFHIYSRAGIPALCTNSGSGVYESAMDVVQKSVERMTRVQGVASQQSGYALNLSLRNFVVSEAGPSPEIIKDACGPSTRIPDNMMLWSRISAVMAEQRGAPPLMVWTGTMFYLVDIPPGGDHEYWESTALYPYERCSASITACLTGEGQ